MAIERIIEGGHREVTIVAFIVVTIIDREVAIERWPMITKALYSVTSGCLTEVTTKEQLVSMVV